MRSWVGRHKVIAGVIALASATASGFIILIGIWSAFSNEPLVPVVVKEARDLAPNISSGIAIGLCAILTLASIAVFIWSIRKGKPQLVNQNPSTKLSCDGKVVEETNPDGIGGSGSGWGVLIRNDNPERVTKVEATLESAHHERADLGEGHGLFLYRELHWSGHGGEREIAGHASAKLDLVRIHYRQKHLIKESDGTRYAGAAKAFQTIAYANMDLETRETHSLSHNVVLFLVTVRHAEGKPLYLVVRVDPIAMDATRQTKRKPVTVKYSGYERPDLSEHRQPEFTDQVLDELRGEVGHIAERLLGYQRDDDETAAFPERLTKLEQSSHVIWLNDPPKQLRRDFVQACRLYLAEWMKEETREEHEARQDEIRRLAQLLDYELKAAGCWH